MKLAVLIGQHAHEAVDHAGRRHLAAPVPRQRVRRLARRARRTSALAHVAVEPLRIAYRSTREIMAVARAAMGPLADPKPPEAPRSGAPVETFRFPGVGRGGRVPGRGAARSARRASRARPWRCWPATPSRPTLLRGAAAGRGAGAAPRPRPGVRLPPRRRGDRRPPGEGARVRLRGDARRERAAATAATTSRATSSTSA